MLCGEEVSLEALLIILVPREDDLVSERETLSCNERDLVVAAGVLNVHCWEEWDLLERL